MVAEVHRRAGDALYGRRDYGAAVAEYCETVGHLEPSYVIRRFLDAQRIHNLAASLAHLPAPALTPPPPPPPRAALAPCLPATGTWRVSAHW